MAAIYDIETGDTITEGLQGCGMSDEAIQEARFIASERRESVHLDDDDGSWIISPEGSATLWAEPHKAEGADSIRLAGGSDIPVDR